MTVLNAFRITRAQCVVAVEVYAAQNKDPSMTVCRFPRSLQSAIFYPATLDLNFLGQGAPDPRATFARTDETTYATYFGLSGVLRPAELNTCYVFYSHDTLEALRRLNLPEPDYEG